LKHDRDIDPLAGQNLKLAVEVIRRADE
jgi:hypothetical protein